MTRCLLTLYPRQWRERYGEEFAALLDNTPLTLPMVLDVVRHAGGLHAGRHRGALRVCAAMVSALVEIVALRARLTVNILWAPTDPARAFALAATVGTVACPGPSRARSPPTARRQLQSWMLRAVVAVAVVLLVILIALVTGLAVPRWRRRTARSAGLILGAAGGVYLVGRGIAELWHIDVSRPETYRNDWGGPHLAGVLAVHTGPAVVVVAAVLICLVRRHLVRRRGRTSNHPDSRCTGDVDVR